MMRTVGKYAISKVIYHSRSSIVFKAVNIETEENVIIKQLSGEFNNTVSTAKNLKDEYTLLKKNENEYVVKTYEFVKLDNIFSIIMEDFGGISLKKYTKNNKLESGELLDIATKITACLGYLHNNHVIHKDINPSNIIYNSDTKKIKLIDFGIASGFSYETMQALHPAKLQGTLPYVSPEQTGRMNRPLDYRTDYYSLGVTLYELACGKLPFATKDAGEMVYFHIAKATLPVHEVNPAVPIMVSNIIAKLMAKNPEERYKSTMGILFDFNKCREQLKKNQTIVEIPLGCGDTLDKFAIPKKLYGREREVQKLLSSFQTARQGIVGLMLVSGYSGIGKTSLVNELHKPVAKENGIFISGKFNQFNQNVPYYALFKTIDQFCSYILAEPELDVEYWKNRMLTALGVNGRLITEGAPRLALIIGEQPVVAEAASVKEAQERFKFTMLKWLGAISSTEHPVVLFIDDVHWADIASLELLEEVLADDSIKGLLSICAYRDNEVNPSHPLMGTIEKIKKRTTYIAHIHLDNLDVRAVAQMAADIANLPKDETLELAEAIHEKTWGNPFYTIEFWKYCNQERLLYYDYTEKRWQWDKQKITENKITDNVVDFLIERMRLLPPATSELLSIASCIGSSFDSDILSQVSCQRVESLEEDLKPAVAAEMIHIAGKDNTNSAVIRFKFCHDRFQQSGYYVLADSVKKKVHLNLAKYYESLEQKDGNSFLFETAGHYARALDLIFCKEDLRRVAETFLRAVHQACLSSAFDTAHQYIEILVHDMPDWIKQDKTFMFNVYIEYHKILYCLAQNDEADRIYAKIEKLAQDPVSLSNSCCLQLVSLSNRRHHEEALMLGTALLKDLGVVYPQDNLESEVQIEVEKFYAYKRSGVIDQLEEKEMLNDAREIAIANLLNRLFPVCLFYNPLACYWMILANVNRMIDKGITLWAWHIGATITIPLSFLCNDFYTGVMLAQKVLQVAEKNKYSTILYRIYHVYSLTSCHWFEDLDRSIFYAHAAYKGSLQNGEFKFACFSFFTSQTAILECCNSLDEMKSEVDAAIDFATKKNNLHALGTFYFFRQFVKALQGETLAYGSFDDAMFDEMKQVEELRSNNTVGLCYYYIYGALLAVLFGDFNKAFIFTEKAVPILAFNTGFYTIALHCFLYSISICKRLGEIEERKERLRLEKVLGENQEWMYNRAKDAPFNFGHMYDLVAAEIKGLEGNYKEALQLYDKAISGANQYKRPYHYALACELAGLGCQQMELATIADYYITKAYASFLTWGATGKTNAMQKKYQQILFVGADRKKASGMTYIEPITTIDPIDLKAVIKAAQTISEEVTRKKLLKNLIKIVIENSGSSQGHIFLKNEDRWFLAASGVLEESLKISLDYTEVIFAGADTKNMPLSMISYVLRTKEPLIVNNILESRFATDAYFSQHKVLSAMCMPILAQDVLKGIVYLENDILTHAFTFRHTEILKILASQAAISIENAVLYSELEDKVDNRTKELKKILLQLELQHKELQSIQMELVKSEERNSATLNAIPDMLFRIRLDGTLLDYRMPVQCLPFLVQREDYLVTSSIYEFLPESLALHILEEVKIALTTKKMRVSQFNDEINGNYYSCDLRVSMINESDAIVIVQDQTELHSARRKFQRLENLHLIGEMAASIGHEVRNPLTTVRGYLQYLSRKEERKDQLGTFELMISELDRANAIITEFLALAKNKALRIEKRNINHIITAIYPLLKADAVVDNKDIMLEIDKAVPPSYLDESEIRQMVINLVRNGLEAIEEGKTVTIKTYKQASYVVLVIQDQGEGIPVSIIEKIGTPFFTTKEKGTGLGLSICYSIAERHKATMDFETDSRGTKVIVKFQGTDE